MATELTAQEQLLLDLAEVRSEPLLDVSPLIGSRHKSEYKQVAFGADFLFFLTSENKVIRRKFSLVHEAVTLSIEKDDITPTHPYSEYLNSIFPSRASGDCLIVSKEEETLYISATGSVSFPIAKLHGFHVISAFWIASESSRKHILLGTRLGNVLEVSFTDIGSVSRDVQLLRLLDLEDFLPISHIHYETFIGAPDLACVYLATCDGLFFLTGPGISQNHPSLTSLFQPYKATPASLRNAMSAAPSPGVSSQFQLFRRPGNPSESFVFLSGSVLMYSDIPEKPESEGSCIVEIKSLPLPGQIKSPAQGCGISSHYLFLLFPDRLLVYTRLAHTLISSTLLPFEGIGYRGMVYYPELNSILVWSNQAFLVHLEGEDKLQWVFLLENMKYEDALAACNQFDPRALPTAKGLYADALVRQGNFEKAVDLYLESDKAIEEVISTLASKTKGRLAPLQGYLECLLDKLEPGQIVQKKLIAQALLSLLVVIKASKSELLDLLRRYSSILDFGMTVQTLQQAARMDEIIFFCTAKLAFQSLFQHYINDMDYSKALETLSLCSESEIEKNLLKTSLVFIQKATGTFYRTLNSLFTEHPNLTLGPILPAIRETPESHLQISASFLYTYISARAVRDSAIHNCYFNHLVKLQDESGLIHYLSKQALSYQRNLAFDFDPDFAVFLLEEKGLYRPLVMLLTNLFRFEEAVEKALERKELTLAETTAAAPNLLADMITAEMEKVTILTRSKAKEFAFLFPPEVAQRLTTESIQRKDVGEVITYYKATSRTLWLKLAAWFSISEDNDSILQIPSKCPDLDFSDIVPYLSKSLPFAPMREQVKSALRKHAKDMAQYKSDMQLCKEKTELVQKDREKKEKESIQGDVTQPCAVCLRPMNRESSFLFPCLHVFHESCLNRFYCENAFPKVSEKVKSLNLELHKEEVGSGIHRKDVKRKLLDLLGMECCYCSETYISTVSLSLDQDETELLSWTLPPRSSR